MKDEQSHGALEQSPRSALTAARIALGLTGPAVPTREHLRFQLDHALARDAVHARLDVPAIQRDLQQRSVQSLAVCSAVSQSLTAPDRGLYLRRPDLGRTLNSGSRSLLEQCAVENPTSPDLVVVLADGLSSVALERHAIAVLDELLPKLDPTWMTAPVTIATEARVGLGDEIGQILRARLTVVLIGERPGLSSPDSLGAYITWQPRVGRTDAERNCISNIRSEGLSYAAAASRVLFYLREAMKLRLTGVGLKEGSASPALPG